MIATEQLIDEGAVIGYQPNLQYIKKSDNDLNISSKPEEDSSGDGDNKEVEYIYSSAADSFENNTQSTAFNNIEYAISNMSSLIDKLSKSFHNGNWNRYSEISSMLTAIENNNEEYVNDFVDYYKNSIDGTIIPELIKYIWDTQKRLEMTEKTLKKLFYGDSYISTDEAKKIDDAYVQKIKENEFLQETTCRNNYVSIAFDAILSKCTSTHAFNANKCAIQIANIITKNSDTSSYSQEQAYLVQKLYNDINSSINSRIDTYSSQQGIEILEKTLYNYYNKRRELLDLYKLMGDNESDFIIQKICEYQTSVNDALKNINKVYIGNQVYLSELCKLETEKYHLLNIYNLLSRNL